MAKMSALILALVVAGAALLYQFGGVRVAMDGSGMWPRFVSRGPNYDALEAHRARQRELPSALPGAVPVDPAVTGASSAVAPEVSERGSRGAAAPPLPEPAAEPTARTPATEQAISDWPDFRGPGRDGGYDATDIRIDWPSDGLPQLWKQPIGLGYASFVVSDGRAFTIEQRRHQEVVAAYDVETGRELWTNGWDGEFVESMGGDGPRATPTYRDGRVYALGALGELRCLDAATGQVIWRRNILEDNGARNLDWGMAAAPLVVDDAVVVLPGGSGGRSVVAYDRRTGTPVWSALDDRQAYTSPMLVTLAGERQILVVTASRAVALSPDGSRLLWDYPWATDMGINAAQPVLLGDDRVFLSASYGQGAAVFEVVRADGRLTTRTIWRNNRMKNRFTSSVLHDGYLYGLDESILACIDAATGELKWKGGRYGYGQLVLAGDHLVVLTERGELALVKATPEGHVELAQFPALEGKTWNHPVIVNGTLLVRNLREMAAFDLRPPPRDSRR
jgi:outer membrane protein assembly factor BamB